MVGREIIMFVVILRGFETVFYNYVVVLTYLLFVVILRGFET